MTSARRIFTPRHRQKPRVEDGTIYTHEKYDGWLGWFGFFRKSKQSTVSLMRRLINEDSANRY